MQCDSARAARAEPRPTCEVMFNVRLFPKALTRRQAAALDKLIAGE
jgi:hypothetical protein